MNFLKTIILVIILAILIGALIVFVPKFLNQTKSPTTEVNGTTTEASAIPIPIPTKPPVIINESSNLKEEIAKIEIPDFKKDFEDLKAELN